MRKNTILLSALAGMFLASCVTINVYFPASAVQEAAKEIVNDVLNDKKSIDKESKPQTYIRQKNSSNNLAVIIVDFLIPVAHAEANLFIDTPKIRSIRSKLKSQHGQIKTHFDSGAVGFSDDGLVKTRSLSGLGIKQKSTLKKQLRQVNSTLSQLYAEIAQANGHPEWKNNVQKTFAKTWVSEMSSGWMYYAKGQWLKK